MTAERRQSLGTAVLAGMLGATMFCLLFAPTFYVLICYIAFWLGWPRAGAQLKWTLLALPAPAKSGKSGFRDQGVMGMFGAGEI